MTATVLPLCYHAPMAQRQKRSVSLPPELAEAIDQAAAEQQVSFSGWLAETAADRLRLDAGRRAVAEWEAEHGAFTEEELAEAEATARRLLGQPVTKAS